MKNKNNNAIKGKTAEKRVAKTIGGTRKAGPNNPDIKRGKDRVEVKNYKNKMNTYQLKKAYQQNHANIIVSTKGFTDDAIEYAKKNMPRIQLREGVKGEKIVKRRTSK